MYRGFRNISVELVSMIIRLFKDGISISEIIVPPQPTKKSLLQIRYSRMCKFRDEPLAILKTFVPYLCVSDSNLGPEIGYLD
jgi:hypothetical protein